MNRNMLRLQLITQIALALTTSLTPCRAVPSLLCVPKTPAAEPDATDERKQYQATTRKIRVYYVNGHQQRQVNVLVINGQVKAILFAANRDRPFAASKIDSNGYGTGIDFRGLPWEFRGFIDH